jgi:spore coat protein CotF
VEDYLDPINSINMPELTDSGIALEFLLTTKTGIRNLSIALTETASPALRKLMKTQLDEKRMVKTIRLRKSKRTRY